MTATRATHYTPRATYTTGEVARLLKVSRQRVQQMIDAGELAGHAIPTTYSYRRVPHAALVAYLERTPDLAETLELVRFGERWAQKCGRETSC